MESGTKSHKEFDDLKKIKQKFYCSDYFDASVNKYGVKCGISLTFCEDNGLVNSKDSYGSFQWYFRYWLGRKLKDDKRQINRWKRIVSRFKDVGDKFDDCSLSPKIRHILLHWGYELTEKGFLINSTN